VPAPMTLASPPVPALPGAHTEDARFDLRYYAHLLWRARLLLVAAALIGLGLMTLYGYLQTPVYRANAMLQIEPPTPMLMNVTDSLLGSGSFWQNADFYNTQFKILKSRGLGDKVVEALKLDAKPEFKGARDPGSLFMGHVEIEPIPESRLVNVSIRHTDPQAAAEWANALADLFIRESVSNRMQQATQVMDWLTEQVKQTQASMQTAQTELIQGLQRQDLAVTPGAQSTMDTSIERLQSEYLEAKTRRITIEAALTQIRDLRSRDLGLQSVPQVAADQQTASLGAELAGLEAQLSTLRGRFREGHPEVLKVTAQIAQTKRALGERASAVAAGLQAEHTQLQKRESELQGAIGGQRAAAVDQSRATAEMETLRKRTDSTKNLYDVLLQKLNETNIAASMRNSNASVVERATVPVAPVWPDKRRIALFGLGVGLLAGVGLVLLRDHFDNTFKDPEEVERYLHTELLAAIPKAGDPRLLTEAYQNLRTALLFARRSEEGQIVLITGTAPQEGKTTTLVNLGKLLAAAGESTILVDCDLRRAQVHDRLGLPREPGVTNYFTQHLDIDTLVQSGGAPSLAALTAGPLPPNPPALLARGQLDSLFAELRQRYRWILVDSPPLASVTDALLLARRSDMVVVIVKHNGIDKRLVRRAVGALRRVGAPLLGVVLNMMELHVGNYYYYYYNRQETPPGAVPQVVKPRPRRVAAGEDR
jgi:succinoglycan biosynthesis transport protein ExoP